MSVFWLMGNPVILVKTPELVAEILNDTEGRFYKKKPISALAPTSTPDALFTANGERWKELRDEHPFSSSLFDDWISSQTADFYNLVACKGSALASAKDPLKGMWELAANATAKAMIGQTLPDSVMADLMTLCSVANKRMKGLNLPPWLLSWRFSGAHQRYFTWFSERIDDLILSPGGNSLIARLLAKNKDLDKKLLAHQAANALPGGMFSMSSVLANALMLLESNRDWLKKIEHATDRLSDQPAASELADCQLVDGVLLESMRVSPPVPIFFRNVNARESVTLGGFEIPKDTELWISNYRIHHDADYWQHPDVFDPHRWNRSEIKKALESPTFFPFGQGPRACVGAQFAMSFLRPALVALLRKGIRAREGRPEQAKIFYGVASPAKLELQERPEFEMPREHDPLDSDHGYCPPLPKLWVLQFGVYLALALDMAFSPWTLLRLHAIEETPGVVHALTADQIRLAAPFVLAISLFTLVGLLDPRSRTSLARFFTAAMLFQLLAFLFAVLTKGYATGVFVAMGFVGVFLVINLTYAFRYSRKDPPQDNAGIALNRPPQLWILWAIQAGLYFVAGVVALVSPHLMGHLVLSDELTHLADEPQLENRLRLTGTWSIVMALLTGFALGVRTDKVWRSCGWMFVCVFSLFTVVAIINLHYGDYSILGVMYLMQGPILAILTLFLLKKKDPWFRENVQESEGWSLSDIPGGVALSLKPVFQGKLPIHHVGRVVDGTLRLRKEFDEEIPEHPIFEPGARYKVHLRFSNQTQSDDAALDVRGCALCISTEDVARLTIHMSTGTIAPFRKARDIISGAPWALGGRLFDQRLKNDRYVRAGALAGMRRAPDSYLDLAYYSKITRHWVSPNEVLTQVRFRVRARRGDGEDPEATLPTLDDVLTRATRQRLRGETRPEDYLRQQLAQERRELVLEAQFHEPTEAGADAWYDPSVEWDALAYPWLPLGTIKIERVWDMEADETVPIADEKMHAGLGYPNSSGGTDPRSVGRSKSSVARTVRALVTKAPESGGSK